MPKDTLARAVSQCMFWNAIHKGLYSIENNNKRRPVGAFAYDFDDITNVLRDVAKTLGFIEEAQMEDGLLRDDSDGIKSESLRRYEELRKGAPRRQSQYGMFIQHLNKLRQVALEASNDGFSLDELVLDLPELERVLESVKS